MARGSIVKRMTTPRDGSKPQARYYVKVAGRWLSDPATGSGFRRKTDAEDYLLEVTGAMRLGTFVEPSTITVAEYADRWLGLQAGRLKPSTLASYRRNLRVHVLPALGEVRLQQITPDMLDGLYVQLLASGKRVKGKDPAPLSSRTVRYIHTIVGAMLGDAVKKGVLVRNPADAATPPSGKATSTGHVTWTSKQLSMFLAHTADHRYGPVWAFLALTGCRRGEALGLRWQDVDLETGRAAIRQNVQRLAGETIIGTPKGGLGRSVALDPGLVAMLHTHRAAQAAEKLLVGPGYTDRGLVFANPDGSPVHPEVLSKAFKRVAGTVGLPVIRLHDLRHTWATLALAGGVHPKVVQERLGHANVSITLNIYSHVAPSMHDDAAVLVAGLVSAHQPSAVRVIGEAVDTQ